MFGYYIENDLNFSFVQPTAARAFLIDTVLTLGKAVTHNGLRFTENGWLSVGNGTATTIATGVITASATNMIVDTEGGAATDDLDTINGGGNGDILLLRSTNSARDIVVKHGTGNIYLNGQVDKTLSHGMDTLLLIRLGPDWGQLSYSDNAV
jgi:hypothetical protein